MYTGINFSYAEHHAYMYSISDKIKDFDLFEWNDEQNLLKCM